MAYRGYKFVRTEGSGAELVPVKYSTAITQLVPGDRYLLHAPVRVLNAGQWVTGQYVDTTLAGMARFTALCGSADTIARLVPDDDGLFPYPEADLLSSKTFVPSYGL